MGGDRFMNRSTFRRTDARHALVVTLVATLVLTRSLGSRRGVSADRADGNPTHTVRLTNHTQITGRLEHRDEQRVRMRTKDGFSITVPLERVHTIARADGSERHELKPLLPKKKRGSCKTIALSTEHTLTIRKNPTTQVHMRIAAWPGQTFLRWFPEVSENVWAQRDADVAKQDFTISDAGALVWSRRFEGKASVLATMTPRDDSVALEIRVTAAPDHDIRLASPANCLHFSAAPEFACNDFSRIHVRVKKQWRSFLDLRTAPGAPQNQSPASVIYREGFLESKRPNFWKGHVENCTMPDRVDHPLILCRSRSGNRAVATASEDYQGLFYNQSLPYLLCIHSAQAGVAIPRGTEAVFREIIWFVDGGIKAAVAAYNRDFRVKRSD